jgi:hypothetical protein
MTRCLICQVSASFSGDADRAFGPAVAPRPRHDELLRLRNGAACGQRPDNDSDVVGGDLVLVGIVGRHRMGALTVHDTADRIACGASGLPTAVLRWARLV